MVDDPDGRVHGASVELRELLSTHLEERFPSRYREAPTLPTGGLEVVEAGTVDFGDGHHPVEHAGLLTPTDWCVHLPDEEGRWRLVAASVCFPTRWVLASKLGRTVREIHAPVSAYDDPLADAVDRFMGRLRPERPMWRLNWNLVDRPDLFQPTAGDPPDPPITVGDAGERVFLRVERQTFVRLPASGAVVFGIEVHRDPLGALAGVEGAVERLAAALDALPEATVAEKGLGRMLAPVTGWLARQAGR